MSFSICITSMCTEEIAKESFNSDLNKVNYANKYNIEYRLYKGRISNRHPQWDKIQCVLQNLVYFDYVIWMDSDVVINNFNISFRELLNKYPNIDAFFCHDVCYEDGVNHLYINSGVMIFKKTEWSFNFLKKVWTSINDYNVDTLNKYSYDGFPHEQGKISELLLNNIHSLDINFKVFDQKIFNTHPNFSDENTFIIHYMGSRQSETHLSDYIKNVEQINKKNNILTYNSINYIEYKKYKICIVSSYTDNIKNIGSLSFMNKSKYCNIYNFSFKIFDKRQCLRHPAWEKIKILSNLLEDNHEHFDYYVWLDNDLFITNEMIDINFIINNFQSYDIIIYLKYQKI